MGIKTETTENQVVKSDRLFIFAHGDEAEQQAFIAECQINGIFAEVLPFMRYQLPEKWGQKISKAELKNYQNGSRPYFTISKANPDHIGHYYNWSYLETVIQKGWHLWLR